MRLSEKVRRLRGLRRMTQADLAGKANVSADTIYNLEGERVEPHHSTIANIARILDVPADWLADDARGLEEIRGRIDLSLTAMLSEIGLGRTPEGSAAPVFPIGAEHDAAWKAGGYPVGDSQARFPMLPGLEEEHGFYCEVFGDSMVPDIGPGDHLYFAPSQTTWKDGDPCLVRTAEYAVVRCVYAAGGAALRLVPTNRTYPERVVDCDREPVQVHPVIGFFRTLKGRSA